MSVNCVPGNFTPVISRLSSTWVHLVIGAYLLPVMSMEPLFAVPLLSHVQLFVTMGCSTPGLPSFTISWSLLKLMSMTQWCPPAITSSVACSCSSRWFFSFSAFSPRGAQWMRDVASPVLPPASHAFTPCSESGSSGDRSVLCVCSASRARLFVTPWPVKLLCPWDSPATILEWVAIFSSRGSSWPRDRTCVSCLSYIGRFVKDTDTMRTFYLNLNSDFKAENFW